MLSESWNSGVRSEVDFLDNSVCGGHGNGRSKQRVYMCMCPIPNGFRNRAISLYSSKIVDMKEILLTVTNAGIYCSSDIILQFA
jgi:hypothetical protein